MNINQIKKKYLPKIIGAAVNTLAVPTPKRAADVAMEIFRTPRKGRVESYQQKFLKKFVYRELAGPRFTVATYDNDKHGKTVLLCHGWESNGYRWRKLYRSLQDTDLRIVMVDAPAHGRSGSKRFDGVLYAEAIATAVEHYQPMAIVGHSVGGYAALYYAGMGAAACLERLVILASPDKFVDISKRYFDMLGYSERVRRAYYVAAESMYGSPPESFSVAESAKNINIPGLIIHDAEDDVNLPYEGRAIHEAWNQSELMITSGLGHSLQDEAVYSAITSYLVKI